MCLEAPVSINQSLLPWVDSSHESEDQNIFFFTWRVFTFLFYFLPGRIIILSNVSMMSSFGVPLLLGSIIILGIVFIKVSYFIACITSDSGWIPSHKFIFLMRMLTLVMMTFSLPFLECIVRAWYSLPIFSSRAAIWASFYEHSSHSLLNLISFFLA